MIKFLDLKKVTESHGDEIKEAVSRVVDSGRTMPILSGRMSALLVLTVWMP